MLHCCPGLLHNQLSPYMGALVYILPGTEIDGERTEAMQSIVSAIIQDLFSQVLISLN